VLKVVRYIQFILHFCKNVSEWCQLHYSYSEKIETTAAARAAVIPDVSNRRPIEWIATARTRAI